MSEADAVARSADGPVTRAWLVRDLRALGVRPGMLLMVHASLSGLGWVVGGVVTVADALIEAVGLAPHGAERESPRGPAGAEGTLVMPAFSGWNTDPAQWKNPPVPPEWHDTIRAELPPFDPRTSPTREMGALPEYFRTLPGVLRSAHPSVSWSALGPLAQQVTAGHGPDHGLGAQSPLGRCYKLGGRVLSLATRRTTVLHLAEYHCDYAGKREYVGGSALLVDGERRWVAHREQFDADSDFEQIRLAFMAAQPPGPETWAEGPTGYGTSRLFAIRPLVDFAAHWLPANRRAE